MGTLGHSQQGSDGSADHTFTRYISLQCSENEYTLITTITYMDYCGVGSEKKASRYASTVSIVDALRRMDVIWRIILATSVGVPGHMRRTPGVTILICLNRKLYRHI